MLKILKIFYFSSLQKFEIYKQTNKVMERYVKETTESTATPNEENIEFEKKNSSNFDINRLEDLFSSKLGEMVLNQFDHYGLVKSLLELIVSFINKQSKSKSSEKIDIINTSFELVVGLIPFGDKIEQIEQEVISSDNFSNACLYGLLNDSFSIRKTFSESLIKLCKLLEYSNRFELIAFLFTKILTLVEDMSPEIEKNSNELFEFFSYLIEIYLSNPAKFQTSQDSSPKDFIKKLLDNLDADINNTGAQNVSLSNELFLGYMKTINKICQSSPEIKLEVSEKYNIMQGILTKILFKQNSDDLVQGLQNYKFVNPDKVDDNKSNRNTNQKIRLACYNFITTMLKDSITNFERFFSVNLLDESQEKKSTKDTSAAVSRYFYNYSAVKKEGHVGLRNLGCICYMNAMLQQFYMMPSLRHGILRTDDNQLPQIDNDKNIDDNALHQVQKMFTFLELSERMDFNPSGWCHAFKDWEGNPTNTLLQQDAQEFLNRFLDKVENQMSPTPYKYTINSILGGKTCSQLICEAGCGSITNRFEDFYNLTLEVKGMPTLYASLDKFILPEKIDEFNCSTCQKKVTITKRNSLASLPNVLIVHLQRMFYNYEIDRNEKINSRLEFPKTLNLKDYTAEELTRRIASKKSQSESSESDPAFKETDEIYFRHSSYYEYHLVGVIIHSGSADSGHYYSYINDVRSGSENEADFNPKDESHMSNWLEFNSTLR